MGLMCDFRRKTEAKPTAEECKFCLSQNCFYNKTPFKSNTANFEQNAIGETK